MNPREQIAPLFEDFEWDVEGILHTNGYVSDIPQTSNPVTSIIEDLAVRRIQHEYDVALPDHTRQYPDLTFEDDERIALDIKTAKTKDNGSLENGVTLGSARSYFQNPDEESPWTKYPYGSYDEHWVLLFVYSWYPDKESREMVEIEEIICNEKWKLAHKSTGSGTTGNIGSSESLEKLRGSNGVFSSRDEFLNYWR